MRKRIVDAAAATPAGDWLDVGALAEVEITSEDPAHPIEAALASGAGWRAAGPGPQTVRLRFDAPQKVRRICLEFVDAQERRQEYVLRGSTDGVAWRDIARQQWNFSASSPREVEEHRVDLVLAGLELVITPDSTGSPTVASLASLRLA